MTRPTAAAVAILPLLLAAAPATQPAAECCAAPAAAVATGGDAAALFEKMKTLVGTWTADAGDGQAGTIEYALTGNGSTLVENQAMHGGMVTMYSLDAGRVVMTHYCGAGNQPRMASAGLAGDTAEFKFVDATGMKSPGDAHMHELTVRFGPDGTVSEDWQLYADGKPTMVVTLKLKRTA